MTKMIYDENDSKTYKKINLPEREYVTNPFILDVVGDVENLDILDIGCGCGEITYQIKKKSANIVVGFDDSKFQIQLAKKTYQEENLKFLVSNLNDFEYKINFDIAFSIHVMHYATNKKELENMLRRSFNSIKKKGKLVFLINIFCEDFSINYSYGVKREIIGKLEEGCMTKITLDDGENKMSFINYLWKSKTYIELLRKVGFTKIEWYNLKVSDLGIKQFGKDYWKNFNKENKNLRIFEAFK